ncbi:MAG: FAD-binding and (Fe-S)-binding domain-containing protein [Anaerobiospirillum succiniciproducens]|uniref:FAD-binding and (Fe-S)-binding domain-containing protein n=1 Tax=Anaerobiospirillum succiniciproducens TaxID=13335 RepID=UPI002A7585DC|nr:FAD-binding and (Fe-S)-binding domain-containing protein [Anaerobiospirillum succiniciproducens]MDY2797906.1 FAD-binding and (Fe-S)-binding domain-containing protein [Anaerobiospirillum succiniciproducens]
MVPRIYNLRKIETAYVKFLEALTSSNFLGEIEDRYAARLLVATDNSVYQRMPQAVLFPKSKEDVVEIFKLASRSEFKSVKFAPRGGGTGTNGQSLTDGIVIDMSRHMKNVWGFNPQERSIYVQPGVIKDELNELTAKENLFFSPELSTSSRATIGGMLSNDAAGQGSLVYGRTSEHILEVDVVLEDGSTALFKPVSGDELKAKLALKNLEGEIYRTVYSLIKDNAAAIKQHFPKLNRFLTGYDLDHAYDPKSDTLNLCRLVCGAEGTLCTVVGAKLDLTVKPTYRALCVVKYENFDSALRHANALIKAGVFSVETVDSKVLNLAKKDPVWLSVKDYITDVEGAEISGVNIVEFNGMDTEKVKAFMLKLYDQTIKQSQKRQMGILGACIVETKEGIAAVYGMRKKAVGLLGSAAGAKKLVAFTEDTVVPPENLADYILEFRALLDGMNVTYGMFGHVDTGLMHVRPALDLTTDEDREKLVKISDGVVELVKKYGGQMWGEHGRGYRSCYGEVFFGELYPLARKVKAAFDKDNRLNPGKICVPFGNETDKLVAVDDPMRGDLDRTIDIRVRDSFDGAMNCNGNGQCFSYSTASLMCPSYRYSKDHVKSPKGYSGLMREWLRLMTERGVDINAAEEKLTIEASRERTFKESCVAAVSYVNNLFERTYNTLFEREDFNHEYLGHVATCLSCKSCKTQCPAHVNSAELNSRFLNFYYSRYLRPSMDFLCMNAERTNPLMARVPRLSNALLQNSLSKLLVENIFKFVDLPKFNERTLRQQAKDANIQVLTAKEAEERAAHYDVIVVSNAFTASYEADGLIDLAKLVRSMGFKVAILKPYTNGKLLVIRGARAAFIRKARPQAERLARLNAKGLTLVGFDPALTICYRDEYKSLIPNCPDFNVMLPEEWLKQALASEKFLAKEAKIKNALEAIVRRKTPDQEVSSGAVNEGVIASCDYTEDFYLFCHCTEQALVPLSVQMWQQILAHFKLRLMPVSVACCGMAGLFGHMKDNLDETRTVYEQNWQAKIRERDFAQCLITGFSCRSQVHRMEHKRANHPIHVLANLLEQAEQESKR